MYEGSPLQCPPLLLLSQGTSQEALSAVRRGIFLWNRDSSFNNLQTSICAPTSSPSFALLFQNSREPCRPFAISAPHPQIQKKVGKFLHSNVNSTRAESCFFGSPMSLLLPGRMLGALKAIGVNWLNE